MEDTTNTTSQPSDQKPLTFGEKAVGLTFNPGNNPDVQKAKELSAQLIDLLISKDMGVGTVGADMKEHAIHELQAAQMWAVKVITWKE